MASEYSSIDSSLAFPGHRKAKAIKRLVREQNIVVPITCMQQKHVITHPDQAGRTRSRQNQNYPEKYFRVTILFIYELQLLCVCYYRSPPEIVYLKCYCEFIFFFNLLIIYFTFYNILFLFTSVILGVVKIGGPWTRSMKGVHGPGPWTGSTEGVHGPGVHVLYSPLLGSDI